jgi:hypothetical protein
VDDPGANRRDPSLPVAAILVIELATLALAGAVVGAVHGAVLVSMLNDCDLSTHDGKIGPLPG